MGGQSLRHKIPNRSAPGVSLFRCIQRLAFLESKKQLAHFIARGILDLRYREIRKLQFVPRCVRESGPLFATQVAEIWKWIHVFG